MDDVFITGVDKRYPKEVLDNRDLCEGNVIAIIYKDILILDEIDLKSSSFITQDGRFYYEIASNIRKKGFNVIDEVTILSECGDIVVNGYEARGGWDNIQEIMDLVNDKNADTYIDNLYRANIILSLHDLGIDLLKPVKHEKQDIIPLKLFKKMDSESVLEWYESKMNDFSTGSSNKVLEEGDLEITDEYLEGLQEGLESGVPFDVCGKDINGDEIHCLPYISNQVGGWLDGTLNMLGGFSSTGKTTILTTILMGMAHRGKKTVIISNEQKSSPFKIQFLTWILAKYFRYYKITKRKLKNKDELTDEDRIMIKKAQTLWNNEYKKYFKFIQIADADISLVKKKVRKYVLNDGFDAFLYDTFKLDIESSDGKQAHLELVRDSRALDKLAKKYDVIGLANVQLAESLRDVLFLNASVLSYSKQIKEVLETLLLMRTTFSEELDPENKKYYCKPFKRVKKGDKWTEEPYQADLKAVYRTIFFEKNRNGESSNDTGIAMLLKFNGGNGTFTESAFCRPKNGKMIG
jgi:replicative DNA helicase